MRTHHILALVVLPLLLAFNLGGCGGAPLDPLAPTGDSSDNVVPDELIVVTTPGADRADLEQLYSSVGANLYGSMNSTSVDLLNVPPDQRDDIANQLDDSPLIEEVADNQIITVDPTPSDEDYLLQWHLEAIDAAGAWEITTGSGQVLVAVLDTGVDQDHPDLAGKIIGGGNTYNGGDWEDGHGHGTAVAGIIGALSDNDAGVASIAWDCPLLTIKVTNDAGATTSWALAAGIDLAVQRGAKVINASFELDGDAIVLRQAELARLRGALVVFAGGNGGTTLDWAGSSAGLFVSATDRSGNLAADATTGPFIDLSAPGVSIFTTQPGGEYGRWSGSSFAAPVVAGVAALVRSANPALVPVNVEGVLRSTADDFGPAGADDRFGAGQVNAAAAVALARTLTQQADMSPPTVFLPDPGDDGMLSGAVLVEVQASDASGIVEVALEVDGAPLASDPLPPYSFVIDTSKFAAGQHVLRATATDIYGNTGAGQRTVQFAGAGASAPPSVTLVSPAAGATVRGVLTVLADVADDAALVRAEILLDGEIIQTLPLYEAQARIAYNWNTATTPTGAHTIAVRAVDASGGATTASASVSVAR